MVYTRDQGKRERKIARRLTTTKVQNTAADKFSKDDTLSKKAKGTQSIGKRNNRPARDR